jgi:nicotinamidase-related amidase
MKALLIIDMQNESFPMERPSHDLEGVVKRINALSSKFRKARLPVIVVQHNGTAQNEYVPDTEGWKVIPEIDVLPNDILLSKTANDCFYKTELEEILKRNGASEVVITGSATDFCIDSTVQAALVKNYVVTVVRDGHTAGSRPHLSAEQVVNHYNWIWENLTPTEGKVVVKKAEQIDCDR